MGDRRLTVREIADTMVNSYKRTQNIIANELGFSKVSARWVLRLLSVEQKRIGLKISRDCLEMFEAYPQNFFDRFVTIDETWVYLYASESKQQ
jgi:hypothetical protein